MAAKYSMNKTYLALIAKYVAGELVVITLSLTNLLVYIIYAGVWIVQEPKVRKYLWYILGDEINDTNADINNKYNDADFNKINATEDAHNFADKSEHFDINFGANILVNECTNVNVSKNVVNADDEHIHTHINLSADVYTNIVNVHFSAIVAGSGDKNVISVNAITIANSHSLVDKIFNVKVVNADDEHANTHIKQTAGVDANIVNEHFSDIVAGSGNKHVISVNNISPENSHSLVVKISNVNVVNADDDNANTCIHQTTGVDANYDADTISHANSQPFMVCHTNGICIDESINTNANVISLNINVIVNENVITFACVNYSASMNNNVSTYVNVREEADMNGKYDVDACHFKSAYSHWFILLSGLGLCILALVRQEILSIPLNPFVAGFVNFKNAGNAPNVGADSKVLLGLLFIILLFEVLRDEVKNVLRIGRVLLCTFDLVKKEINLCFMVILLPDIFCRLNILEIIKSLRSICTTFEMVPGDIIDIVIDYRERDIMLLFRFRSRKRMYLNCRYYVLGMFKDENVALSKFLLKWS